MKKIIFGLALVLILFVISIFALGLKTKKIYDTQDLIGKPISKVDLVLLNKDTNFNTQDLKKNNFTLINFWASWCAPCRAEHPLLMELSRQKNLKILGVNFKDKKINASNFLKSLGNPYHYLAKDEQGKQSINFGIYGIPESILIDKEFTIIKKFVGPLNIEDLNEIKTITNSL